MLLSLLVLLPQGAPEPAPAWSELPVPALCAEPAGGIELFALLDGAHVDVGDLRGGDTLRGGGTGTGSLRAGAGGHHLPLPLLAELLEDDARRRGEDLRVLRPVPPLVASGSPAALERARATCLELDSAARRREIRLEAWLVPGGAEDGAQLGAPHHVAVARSGEPVRFGERVEHAFLATYRAEVAASSEIADPVFGTVRSGRTLHLCAWRVEGGRAALVEGLLDLAELAALEAYDTGSPDLGLIQRPTVRSLQVRFGGRVASGGRLRVTIEGAPLGVTDWTLVVAARTQPDAAAGPAGWRVADVALLEQPVRSLELPSPGLGLGSTGIADLPATALEPLGALQLFGHLQAASGVRRAPAPQVHAVPGLLVAPSSEQELWSRAEALIAAAERARLGTAELEVRAGALRVVLPVSEGLTARVLAGEERTWVVDYEPQIAPESWLASPDVRRAFDGVLVQGRPSGSSLSLAWWRAATVAGASLEPRDTTHGRLEPVQRAFRGDRARIVSGAGPRVLDAGADGPLSVALGPR